MEIGEEFNGIDLLRPVFREKLDSTRETLLEARDRLALPDIEVVLRDPFDEELEEMRSWLQEVPPIA